MKKLLALLLAAVMVLGLAACGSEPAGTTPPPSSNNADPVATTEAPKPTESQEEPLTVALVVADSFGDRSFYDSSKQGCDQLQANRGINLKTIECGGVGYSQNIYNAADTADVVVLVGWEFYDVEIIAPEYPEVYFIWVDNVTTAPVDNVLCIPYAQNEGSFLAGYVAAKMSTSGVIGAVGGEDGDVINDFLVGYRQGAQYANPAIDVQISYANTYTDPAVGKECALALHDKGADVIFQVASKTGDGVFQAAQEEGFYAIGVDADQKYIADDVIICSMVKQVGQSIYDAIALLMDGDDSRFGTNWTADMVNGYIGLGYGEEGSTQQISDELKAEVEELVKKIVSGEIVVETTR